MVDLANLPNIATRSVVRPGEPAPDFALPALHREGTVSLEDYRHKSPVLLAIMRGLYCPFCRRHIAHMGGTRQRLAEVGVEVLVVVATPAHRAKAYLKFRPAQVSLAADPMLETHRAFGIPRHFDTPEAHEAVGAVPINPFGDLPEPRPMGEVAAALSQAEPYEWTGADQEAYEREQIQYAGQFLVDRHGIVRWSNIEGAEGPTGIGKFPSDEVLLAAASSLHA